MSILLGFGDTSAEALKRVFLDLCTVESPNDGLTFLPDSVHVEAIVLEPYGDQLKITLKGDLAGMLSAAEDSFGCTQLDLFKPIAASALGRENLQHAIWSQFRPKPRLRPVSLWRRPGWRPSDLPREALRTPPAGSGRSRG